MSNASHEARDFFAELGLLSRPGTERDSYSRERCTLPSDGDIARL